MLTKKIKAHIIINGFVFCLIEFLVMIFFLAPISWYYLTHYKYLFAFIVIGIVINCLPFVFFGIQSLLKKEESIGIQKQFDPKIRRKIKQQYPHILIDTFFIVLTILIPFLVTIILAFEFVRKKSSAKFCKRSQY